MLVTSRGVTKERIGFFRMDIIPAFDFDNDSIPSTSGIYAIVNRLNQHIYVGSAVNLLQKMRAARLQHPHMLEQQANQLRLF
jgi:excinuclease UvrABC nuclease subunit